MDPDRENHEFFLAATISSPMVLWLCSGLYIVLFPLSASGVLLLTSELVFSPVIYPVLRTVVIDIRVNLYSNIYVLCSPL